MPEPNEQTTSPLQPKEICTIRILFPVKSDEQAIEYKRKIGAILSEIPDAQIHFALVPSPAMPPVGMPHPIR